MNTKKYQLEIACFNNNAARIAQQNGADRIELCANMNLGGTTPDLEDIKTLRSEIHILFNVMVRPRGGNFVYTDDEFEQMKTDIKAFKELKVDGFVFGILDGNNQINVAQNKALVALAAPIPCTFHRAFDQIHDQIAAIDTLVACGFKTILTSGTANNVTDGLQSLKILAKHAKNKITLMPGGGLRSSNCKQVKKNTHANYYHSSAITDNSENPNPTEVALLKKNLSLS